MKLKPSDKKVLENAFDMSSGYVLDFSDKTMGDFFAEQFEIFIYDSKYDYDYPSRSKANRLRGVLQSVDEHTAGRIILGLIDYKEASERNFTEGEVRLIGKAKQLGSSLLEFEKDVAAATTGELNETQLNPKVATKKFKNRYSANNQDLVSGTFIDDSSLYLYFLISKNVLCNSEPIMSFIFFQPFEWSSYDYLSFLLRLTEDYDIELTNIYTEMGAVDDDFPSWEEYENEILEKMSTASASVKDLKRAIILYEDNKHLRFTNETNKSLSDLLGVCFNYTSFKICLTDETKAKMEQDIQNYIDLFKANKLLKSTKQYRIREATIESPLNMATYDFQEKILLDHLLEQWRKYGDKFIIKNIFVEDFPNTSPSEITSSYMRERYRKKDMLFFHTVISLHYAEILKINNITNNWSFHEDENYTHNCHITLLPNFLRFTNDPDAVKGAIPATPSDAKHNASRDTIYYESGPGVFYINKKEIEINKGTTIELLLKTLLPLGKEKSVTVTFKETTTERSKNNNNLNKSDMSDDEMYPILQSRVKDLMTYLRKNGVKTKLSLSRSYDSGTVFLYERKR
jgi:hypothetical protein